MIKRSLARFSTLPRLVRMLWFFAAWEAVWDASRALGI